VPEVRGTGGGLTRRMIAASVLLALLVAGSFVFLLLSIGDIRGADRRSVKSQEVLVAANQLERLLLDLETGQRGFFLTGQERFLEPWNAARREFPHRAATLLELVAGDPATRGEASQIARRERSYIHDYAVPLVNAARRGDPSVRGVAATDAGKRRIDAMRRDFNKLINLETGNAVDSKARVDSAQRQATVAAAAGVGGSILLIALYAAYLMRAIVRPVRRAALMAGRLAGGDLSARMPETGAGEIGALEHSFNVMGRSLEQSRVELAALAEEQAALRRVATLVAQGAPPPEVFTAVAGELAHQLAADVTKVIRFEPDATATAVGGWSGPGRHVPIGARLTLEGEGVAIKVKETGQPARTERFEGPPGSLPDYFRRTGVRSGVGSPIIVEGVLWGVAIAAFAHDVQLAADSEARISGFTELAATAISNAQSREELRRVADEQAALRRVATLVAEGASPPEVFAAVGDEAMRLLDLPAVTLARYERDGTATVIASPTECEGSRVGANVRVEGSGLLAAVLATGRSATIDYESLSGTVAANARATGVKYAFACPIIVEGRTWGAVIASTSGVTLLADDEARLQAFTELAATAIANAEAQAKLTASRARIVATADETRRQIERDLHDGAQQRLVSLTLQLRAAQAAVPPELRELGAELDRVAAGLNGVQDELREYARGIHPAILAEGGLGSALKTLARRSTVPVDLDVRTHARLPERIEVGAYYVVSEALANAAKHANASRVTVDVEAADSALHVSVRDDGVGGADFARGSGLMGLKDRIEALGGRIAVESAPGKGTTIAVDLPLADVSAVGSS
jgi:signal transduction histidine kinase/CHASE3 domain sensor protein